MSKINLETLFSPKSIAIVGASNKKEKIGTVLANNITKLGYKGEVFFVNPSYKILGWKKCYPSLEQINSQVDLAILAIPAKFVLDTIEKSADKIKNYIIISAGFSETGAAGKKLEEKIAKLAAKKGLNILGPNCLGYIAPGIKLNASFAGGLPDEGNVAFISQSGALAVALMDRAKKEKLSFSNIISVGNKMQISEAELIEYLGKDDSTKVIAMYLEGIKDGAEFIKIASEISLKKPIVILKAGKTAKAQQAIASHTGALAGSDDITSVALEKAGVIRANDLDEFVDLIKLLSNYESPKSSACAVITNAGGAGVLATDAFKDKNIALLEIGQQAKKKLAKLLPQEASVENPIDLLGDAQEDRYQAAFDMLKKEKVENIFCLLTPQDQTRVDQIATTIIGNKNKHLNIILVFIGGVRVAKAIEAMTEKGLVNFSSPEAAINVYEKYRNWQLRRETGKSIKANKADKARKDKSQEIIEKGILQNKKALSFSDSAKVMKLYGIEAVDHCEVSKDNLENIPFGFPLALKVDSDEILHKTDKGGLRLGIKDKEGLIKAFGEMEQAFPGETIIAQSQKDKFAEIILGIKKDPIFGPVIVYGLGGIYTEVFKLVNFLIPPMDIKSIEKEIMKSKISFLFEGARGQGACNPNEFAKILSGLMDFAAENSQVNEFDINPLFVYNDGSKSIAVDIKIIF